MTDESILGAVPGAGATIFVGSDRIPATVLSVTGTRRNDLVQEDEVVLGSDGRYEFRPNPKGSKRRFSYRKGVGYVATTQMARGGTRIKIGVRDYYYDPSF